MADDNCLNVGGTQAYLTVPASIKDRVLAGGYICNTRNQIPCAHDFHRGTEGYLRHATDKDEELVVLEVYNVPPEWIQLKDGRVDKIKPTDKKEVDGEDKVWLKPQYLRDAICCARLPERYSHTKCMFCGSDTHLDKDKLGKIGEARFKGEAFLCSPCTKDECVREMKQRSKRLNDGPILTLFHKTSKIVANQIEGACHGRFLRGDYFDKDGAAGGGIYFGHTARECSWKYEAKGAETVTYKCKVKMGRTLESARTCKAGSIPGTGKPNEMFRNLLQHPDGPYDSVTLDRAAKGSKPKVYPVPPPPVKGTRIEDIAVGEPVHPGYEFVIYSWDHRQS